MKLQGSLPNREVRSAEAPLSARNRLLAACENLIDEVRNQEKGVALGTAVLERVQERESPLAYLSAAKEALRQAMALIDGETDRQVRDGMALVLREIEKEAATNQ